MRAVYEVRSCRGNFVDHVVCDADGDPNDSVNCVHAVDQLGYDGCAECRCCGDCEYRANFVGYPVETVGTTGHLDAVDRDSLILTLEALLAAVRNAPEDTQFVSLTEDISFLG